jgi:CobQ-like glutamine amidotransferase family enzyme
MSCKAAIDDVQQSAQTAENEYDIHVVNRAQELDQRLAQKENHLKFTILLSIDGNIQ